MSSRAARLYIGTDGLSVWTSDDGGETLVRMQSETGLYSGSQVWALASVPGTSAVLAGTDTGLYRYDRAANWWTHIPSPMDDRLITALAFAPGAPNRLLAGTQPAGLFCSEDGGATWRDLEVPMKPYVALRFRGGRGVVDAQDAARVIRHWTRVTQIVFAPNGRIFAGVEVDHAWRSDDDGRTWQKLTEGFASPDIHGLAVAARRGCIYATSNAGLHVSRDGGTRWAPLPIDSPWQYVRAIVARPDGTGTWFMGNGNGAPGSEGRLYRSRDDGATWEDVRLPGPVQSSVYFLAVDPGNPQLAFACTSLGQFFRTTDGGEAWSELPRRLGEIRAMLVVANGR